MVVELIDSLRLFTVLESQLVQQPFNSIILCIVFITQSDGWQTTFKHQNLFHLIWSLLYEIMDHLASTLLLIPLEKMIEYHFVFSYRMLTIALLL